MADYNEKTVQELKDEAKSRGLHGYSDKNKDELVALLEESDQGDGSSESDSAADEMEPAHEGGRGAAQTEDRDFASRSQEDTDALDAINDPEQTGDSPEDVESGLSSALEDEDKRREAAEAHAQLEHHSAASDPDNPAVVEALSPEGQEALEEMGEVEAKEADLALDASGPLHLESPKDRIMGGAISEEHAKEQEKLIGELPEDYVGNIRGDGYVPSEDDRRKGSGPNGEVLPEDVIDFPPPLEDLEQEKADLANGRTFAERNAPYAQHEAARAAFPDEGETVAKDRLFNQRAQLYTDGISGAAEQNTILSYRTNDVLAASEGASEEGASEEGSSEEGADQRREDRNEPEQSNSEE